MKEPIIGNTPMIKINYEYKGESKYIYTKLEYYNLTGSIKDRVAYYIIKNAKERGILKEGMSIVEATSGNTGIALAALGSYGGHKVYIFMPDWASEERIKLMKAYGATVILYSKEEGGFSRCISEAEKMAKNENSFLANQFANKDNFLAHYETTGEEIIKQTPEDLFGFVSGVGTGGTLMGTGIKLKEKFKDIKIVAIEPDKMPLISTGKIIGDHKIEGIGDEFIPDLIDRNKIDDIFLVNDEDSINMSRKIARELGLGIGISSGANFIGSVMLNNKINQAICTVFADDNKKYLTTDLSNEIDKNPNFLSNQIKLNSYEII
ncbi:MAG: cysteine synthase family protein [Clostridia bacterium]|nr:cysteine synthase family protein [Clostridia bacterium]